MVGRLIDGRYQIQSRIARGGMATVYVATDLRLERRVALKVMHGHLADDVSFRERFIQEARSAARLAHPNVVNVFDQGQDSEMAYLVMEYLPGITLRDLLVEHRMLTSAQTIDIMEAVLGGLAAAHKAGIVHRDLKPENVLLADDGRIKIGDFGLARAASANTATGTALLGTIAYLSPELVTRGTADARSDIYAAGIMMFEMLVGNQPFLGDAPMQIAYQHANSDVPAPSSQNPTVPIELDHVVLASTAREPDDRPRNAQAMLEQLHHAQGQLGSSILVRQSEPTRVLTALTPGLVADETQVLGSRGSGQPPANPGRTTGELTAGAESTLQLADSTRGARQRSRWIAILVIALVAAAATTGWYFGVGPGSRITIPSTLSGLAVQDATAQLVGLGFTVNATTQPIPDPFITVGLVAATDPAVGQSVAPGTLITLLVSSGPRPIPVPTLVGLSEQQATTAIAAAPFTLAEPILRQFDATIGIGTVLDALAADGTTLVGVATYGELQKITMVVSAGPLPDLAGLSVTDAKTRLAAAGLIAGATREDEYSDTIAQGLVVRSQAPEGVQAVRVGDAVDLITSRGVELITIPEVVGLTWDVAKPQLVAAGFALDYNIFADAGAQFFTVTTLTPGGGTQAKKGSTVKVTFSS